MGIINVWQELFQSSRDYTHYSGSLKVYARLDYFFMFKVDRFKVKDCDMLTRDLSDHNKRQFNLYYFSPKKIQRTETSRSTDKAEAETAGRY